MGAERYRKVTHPDTDFRPLSPRVVIARLNRLNKVLDEQDKALKKMRAEQKSKQPARRLTPHRRR